MVRISFGGRRDHFCSGDFGCRLSGRLVNSSALEALKVDIACSRVLNAKLYCLHVNYLRHADRQAEDDNKSSRIPIE